MRPLLLLITLILASCSSVETRPFDSFSSSLRGMDESLSSQAEQISKESKDAEIESIAKNTETRFSDFAITPINTYKWKSEKQPLYIQFSLAVETLKGLTSTLENYSELLKKLASNSYLTEEQLVGDAQNLNSEIEAINEKITKSKDKNISLLSSISVSIFQNYLQHKGRKELSKVIVNTQPMVQQFSEVCIEFVRILNNEIKTHYQEDSKTLSKRWNSTQKTDLDTRKKIFMSLMDLNEGFIQNLAQFNGIEGAYASIPFAHQDLGSSLKEDKTYKAKLSNLTKFAKEVQSLSKKLKEKP